MAEANTTIIEGNIVRKEAVPSPKPSLAQLREMDADPSQKDNARKEWHEVCTEVATLQDPNFLPTRSAVSRELLERGVDPSWINPSKADWQAPSSGQRTFVSSSTLTSDFGKNYALAAKVDPGVIDISSNQHPNIRDRHIKAVPLAKVLRGATSGDPDRFKIDQPVMQSAGPILDLKLNIHDLYELL